MGSGNVDDERLTGLIAYLLAYHGGGFVNNTIQRDELLSILSELRDLRAAREAEQAMPVRNHLLHQQNSYSYIPDSQ
jgi:hypothetical protein